MLHNETLGVVERKIVCRIADYVRSLPRAVRKESLRIHAKQLAIALGCPEEPLEDALLLSIAELDKQHSPGEGPGPATG